MPGCVVVNKKNDPDLGFYGFTFKNKDKVYTVLPKNEEGYNRLDDYYRYVQYICKKPGVNPYTYKYKGKSPKDLFIVRPAGSGNKEKEKYDVSQIIKDIKNKPGPNKRDPKKPLPVEKLHPKTVPPEGEQMSLFASDKNKVKRVLLKYAGWKDNYRTFGGRSHKNRFLDL